VQTADRSCWCGEDSGHKFSVRTISSHYLLRFTVYGRKDKAAIVNHLHDHVDHLSIRQQSQQLAGEGAVPYSVAGCCEVDKHSSGLLCWKAILDVLCQQGDLVYGRPPLSKARQLLWEQWVDDWFDTSFITELSILHYQRKYSLELSS